MDDAANFSRFLVFEIVLSLLKDGSCWEKEDEVCGRSGGDDDGGGGGGDDDDDNDDDDEDEVGGGGGKNDAATVLQPKSRHSTCQCLPFKVLQKFREKG